MLGCLEIERVNLYSSAQEGQNENMIFVLFGTEILAFIMRRM